MNKTSCFDGIYTDFFGVESSKKDISVIHDEDFVKKSNHEEMEFLFKAINVLNITDDSKILLKKVLEYMRKYNEKIENNYISFALLLVINEIEIRKQVEDILYRASSKFSYIANFDKKVISLYEKEINFDFEKMGLVSLIDISGLKLMDIEEKIRFFLQLEKFLKSNGKNITLISGTKDELFNFFLGNEKLKNQYFDLKIEGQNPDSYSVYESILEKVVLSDALKVDLLDYINKTYTNESNYTIYKNELVKYISFNKSLPKLEINKNLEDIFKELNELVGLEKVKKVLYELVDVIELKDKTRGTLNIKNLNLHMVFLGNSGTGKTTIARIIADILYNLNYIKENKLIEVSSKDLVAEYVGQTAPKTIQVIEKSLNGVLFVDEAYTLSADNNSSYNAEAIATLIQAMENYRDKLVVIFAGYTKEMQSFLNSNSGITSRIGYTLEFDDYTTKELVKIFLGMMKKSGFVVTNEAIDYVEEIINKYRNVKNFGNARFVRNIYEKTIVRHASNVKNKTSRDILRTIVKEDINIDNLIF